MNAGLGELIKHYQYWSSWKARWIHGKERCQIQRKWIEDEMNQIQISHIQVPLTVNS